MPDSATPDPSIDAIVFDYDDTLADTLPARVEAMRLTFAEAFYLGSLMCILPVLAHRAGVASEPAPAITTHRFYWQTERAVSLGSVLGLSVLFLFAL